VTPPRTKLRSALAVLASAVLLGAAACDSSGSDEDDQAPASGGTLRVALTSWPNHLDPQRIAAALEANVSKLVTRTLTTFRMEVGDEASELVADLATDIGRPNADSTVWEFTLKEGVRWEDGEPVTCQDLKYGVQRRYTRDTDRQTGLTVPFQFLRDNDEPYQGPWLGGDNGGAGLESVECMDQRVIRYHLDKPVGDFNFAVSLAVFAPVRPGADDDREAYNRSPLATGPYRVVEHRADPDAPGDNRLVLERNPHWDRATDPNRPAYPDRIVFARTDDAAVMTNNLVNDEGRDRNRIFLDTDIAPTFLQQVMTDPELSQRVAHGPQGAVRYLPINVDLVPQLECRQALAYALNKRKFRSVLGGQLVGELATGMIPPNLAAHQDFDPHGTEEFPDGQPERAAEILADAEANGIDCPDEISFAYPDTAEIRRVATTVVESYQRIGIKVNQVALPPGDYFTAGGILGEQGWELTWLGWVPDWPNGSAVIPALFDGRASGPGTPAYVGRLNDERINEKIDDAFAVADLERQYRLWGAIDRELMEMAVAIPVLYTNALRMHGSNVRGALIHPQLAMPDISILGLVDPSQSGSS
jgi:peptide/nickel transport system substrate-binding protein